MALYDPYSVWLRAAACPGGALAHRESVPSWILLANRGSSCGGVRAPPAAAPGEGGDEARGEAVSLRRLVAHGWCGPSADAGAGCGRGAGSMKQPPRDEE